MKKPLFKFNLTYFWHFDSLHSDCKNPAPQKVAIPLKDPSVNPQTKGFSIIRKVQMEVEVKLKIAAQNPSAKSVISWQRSRHFVPSSLELQLMEKFGKKAAQLDNRLMRIKSFPFKCIDLFHFFWFFRQVFSSFVCKWRLSKVENCVQSALSNKRWLSALVNLA